MSTILLGLGLLVELSLIIFLVVFIKKEKENHKTTKRQLRAFEDCLDLIGDNQDILSIGPEELEDLKKKVCSIMDRYPLGRYVFEVKKGNRVLFHIGDQGFDLAEIKPAIKFGQTKLYIEHPIVDDSQISSLTMLVATLDKWAGKGYYSAVTEPLTGLCNRRGFAQRLDAELQRSKRLKHHFSLMILDVDKLKELNDNYGHPIGDQVLRKIAKVMTRGTRDYDVVARLGGDEFAILLPETKQEGAKETALKILRAVKRIKLPMPEEPCVSLSIGIASYPDSAREPKSLYERADKAMYRSKTRKEGESPVTCDRDMAIGFLETELST